MLLKFGVSRIDDNRKASEIVLEVDVLKANSQIKVAWEISDQTDISCFRKCGFRNKAQDRDVETLGQDEDEEFVYLVKEHGGDVDVDYVDFDKDIASSMPVVDAGSISWHQEIRKEIIEKHGNPVDKFMDVSSNEDVDEEI